MTHRNGSSGLIAALSSMLLASCLAVSAWTQAQRTAPDVKVVVDHHTGPAATLAFKFASVPSPVKDDAASAAALWIVDGESDPNGGAIGGLTDGLLPRDEDEPGANFFFNAGTPGGSFRLDLRAAVDIAEINTYSWHPNTRGPQVYTIYASDGTAAGFTAAPKGDFDPAKTGWTWIASVDTRPARGDGGGQYGVSLTSASGSLGKYRYLLFVCRATEADDDYGNTFFSEIDVVVKR